MGEKFSCALDKIEKEKLSGGINRNLRRLLSTLCLSLYALYYYFIMIRGNCA